MPWKHNGVIIKEGRAWTDRFHIQHPSNWASSWSDSEKLDHDMQWEDPPAYFDERFYWGVGLEKSLADSSDGTIGLKTVYKNQNQGGSADARYAGTFDFNVFLGVGESLQAQSSSTACFIQGSTRQIADINGTLVQPSGFTPQ